MTRVGRCGQESFLLANMDRMIGLDVKPVDPYW